MYRISFCSTKKDCSKVRDPLGSTGEVVFILSACAVILGKKSIQRGPILRASDFPSFEKKIWPWTEMGPKGPSHRPIPVFNRDMQDWNFQSFNRKKER